MFSDTRAHASLHWSVGKLSSSRGDVPLVCASSSQDFGFSGTGILLSCIFPRSYLDYHAVSYLCLPYIECICSACLSSRSDAELATGLHTSSSLLNCLEFEGPGIDLT